ncbi:hypothetical protein CY0110_19212 [Crocosphaera chwakensis CCY0110]|uniref:Uncharacterized protein n=2 Tax=Crocosphaera TaxID=263510 RepID=A3IJH4_9CHRO|nr:hypothetical protein CY0110_19212 [Crocosphaera chwakensis CCY0110]
MTTEEHYGLLGGSLDFIEEIKTYVPNLDQQVYGCLERLRLLLVSTERKYPDVTINKWVPELLTHVYGQQEAEKILQKFHSMPPGYWNIER